MSNTGTQHRMCTMEVYSALLKIFHNFVVYASYKIYASSQRYSTILKLHKRMKIQFYILTICLLTSHFVYGQKVKTPKNIQTAVTYLQTDCPDSLKLTIKGTNNSRLINLCYPWGGDYKTIFQWTKRNHKKSKIRKYLINKGISDNRHQQAIILIAFKQALLGQTLIEDEIIKPYKAIEDKWRAEDKARFTADSIRGVYIPKDIEDCCRQIDSFLSDSMKAKAKQWTENEFSSRAHMGLGMWMRNNWQLWGGSRLSKYFNLLGIYHPDDMSGFILDSYHRYLTGNAINLEEQIKFFQDYLKKKDEKYKKK